MPLHLPRVARLLAGVMLIVGTTAIPGPALAAEGQGATDTWIVTLRRSDASALPTRPGGLRPTATRIARERAAVTSRTIASIETQVGFQATQRYTYAVAGFAATLDARQVASLRRDRRVVAMRRARPVELAGSGGQVTPTSILRIGAPPGDAPATSADVAVAVVDTGVGRWEGGAWRHGNELNIVGGVNAYGSGEPCGERINSNPGAYDDTNGHGTHVAGTIGAGDNTTGVVGVAPGVRLFSVRVFQGVQGSDATVICGLDWIAAWNMNHPGEDQDIDVVNMSLRGYALPTENAGCGTPGNEDPEEIAVCAVIESGATVVVAAGNESDDVSSYIPSRYESVITVSAMSDFDGVPGGLAQETCVPPRGTETDDTYSLYSNFGPDVDITAPGTCVRSTSLSAADGVTVMSGTSMATPHVSGAIARYLGLDATRTPAQVRTALLASASLDWDAATDPDGLPDRLLDVAALTSSTEDLAVFAVPQVVTVPGGTDERTVKVRIQRTGGFAGAVDLSTDGDLPDGVASATIDDGTIPADGLGGDQTLTITFMAEPPDGERPLVIRADGAGAGPSDQTTVTLRFDGTAPAIGAPWPRIVLRTGTWSDVAPVRLSWSATDNAGALASQELQRSRRGGSFSVYSRPGTSAGRTTASMEKRIDTAWRIKAVDLVGNSAISDALATRLVPVQARRATVGAGWTDIDRYEASHHDLLATDRRHRTVSLRFTGRAVAVVAPTGPGLGRFRVRIDGDVVATVDQSSKQSRSRRIVFASAGLMPGEHTIRVTSVLGTVELDAFLILQ